MPITPLQWILFSIAGGGWAFGLFFVVRDYLKPSEDAAHTVAHGDSFPAPILDHSFHKSEYRIRSITE